MYLLFYSIFERINVLYEINQKSINQYNENKYERWRVIEYYTNGAWQLVFEKKFFRQAGNEYKQITAELPTFSIYMYTSADCCHSELALKQPN